MVFHEHFLLAECVRPNIQYSTDASTFLVDFLFWRVYFSAHETKHQNKTTLELCIYD